MAAEHVPRTLSKVWGRIEHAPGRVTGSWRQHAGGIAHQVEGSARQGVGDIQDAAQRHEDHPPAA